MIATSGPSQGAEAETWIVWVQALGPQQTLRVEIPELPDRSIAARVADPAFEDEDSVYRRAAGRFLKARARPTYDGGRLVGLDIDEASLAE